MPPNAADDSSFAAGRDRRLMMRTAPHALVGFIRRALTGAASLMSAAALAAAAATLSLPEVVPAPVAAAEIEVYSAGAVEPGLLELVPAWTRETGHVAKLTVAVPAVLRQRVEAGETPDVLIAPPAVIDALVQAGKVKPEGRVPVGRVGVAMVVRRGAPAPDISTTERFKQAVLGADSLVYNRASTGTYFERVLDRLGIADAVKRGRHRSHHRDTGVREKGHSARRAAPRGDPELHRVRGGRSGRRAVTRRQRRVHPVHHAAGCGGDLHGHGCGVVPARRPHFFRDARRVGRQSAT
jgi:ABC-type molybdate transport system substrate-binding protein